MQYHFKRIKGDKEPTIIIFAQANRLFEFDFVNEVLKEIANFEIPLTKQPEFFLMNKE